MLYARSTPSVGHPSAVQMGLRRARRVVELSTEDAP